MSGFDGLAALRGARQLVGGHPYHAAIAAVAVGLALAPLGLELAMLVAALAAIALSASDMSRLGILVATLLVIGGAVGTARIVAIDAHVVRVSERPFVEATAILLERPRASQFGSSAEVELTAGSLAGTRLMARAPADLEWGSARPGAELRVIGAARPALPSTKADFDYPAYLRRRGVAGELLLDAAYPTGGARTGLAGHIDAMRSRAETATARGLSPERGDLIRGMVLGQDEAIAVIVRDDFRRAGLAHILAVSGQNVMLLGLLALPLLAAAGLGQRARLVALVGLIAVYVPLAGAGPSLQRAGVMGAAGLVAIAVGRPASRAYALLLAAAVTLALNPRIVGDPGWQLSFAAVVGILALGPSLRRSVRALPRPLADGIAITVAATLATSPLLAHHFEAVSLVGLPANLLALPAVALAMWIGMLQIALGQLTALGGPIGSVGVELAELLGAVNALPLAYIAEVARRFAALPQAQVGLSLRSPVAVGAAYAVLGAAAFGLRYVAHRIGPTVTAGAGLWRTTPPLRRYAAVGAGLTLIVAGAIELAAPPDPPDRLTVSFLDVGQGDATLIQHPDGAAVLFDAGPEEARTARLVRAAGVRRLSAVVATHASADHHGGIAEVLERFPVDLLIDGGDGTADPTFNALLEQSDALGVRRMQARAGQRLRLGGLTVDVLSPPPRPPGPAPEDPNPRAVAAVVSAGSFDLFLSADAESPSLLPLELSEVEAMKVSHHGSADEGLPAVLERLRPEVAAIEVGENTYGHPTPSTLAALEGAGARVYRTDEHGTVTLTVDVEGARVATER